MALRSNNAVDWQWADVVLLDMDGTLLDLGFDEWFWIEVVPDEYARRRRRPKEEAQRLLRALSDRHRGTLDWYGLDFWSRELGFDVIRLKEKVADRVKYLPRAREFLARLAASDKRIMLVTNADANTLAIKHEQTGICGHFEEVVLSHDLGFPKEDARFWARFARDTGVRGTRAVFIDDTDTVLDAAHRHGIERVVKVARPDSRRPARRHRRFVAVNGVADFLSG